MSQPRMDRQVVGGRRATAGGRAHALRARGHNEVVTALRQGDVIRYRQLGWTFRAIAAALGLSTAQAHRDYWAALTPRP